MADLAEDITVLIEGDGEAVTTDADGNIAIDQPDGGVVVQLNPPRRGDPEDDDLKNFYVNIADKIGEGELLVLGNMLHEAVDADDKSRAEWLANRASGMELLGLMLQDPKSGSGDAAVDGQSVVTNPLLLEAVLKGWANAQAELLPAEGPCKVTNYADIPNQKQDELGEAFQRDMNFFLTTVATEFVPETSHMLLWGTYFGGSGFKKVYTHPLKQRPCSESVAPQHLIVSDATKDFAACERITHEITMRQTVMKRYMFKGIYRDIDLAPPTPQPNQVDEQEASQQGVQLRKDRPEDQPYTLWEIQCELDLDQFAPPAYKGKGVPLPYLVTMDKDSQQILAVRRDWKPEDPDCNRKQMYVKYPYIPGPGFYGTGLLNVLGNSSAAMTAAWRLSLDAGMYANFPAFILDKLAGRQNTSDFRLAPGQAQPIETGGRPLKDVVAELPYKDVTAGLLTLMDKITEQSKAVGGAPDIPVGEGMANIPVGTMLSHIEQATKVMAAAHKGQHAALDMELTLIADLFRENPESFWKGNKSASGYWTTARLVEALDTRTLVPKSDPNVPSHIHRVMKAVALAELMKTPLGALMNPEEVLRRILMAMREDPSGLIKEQGPQQPSPEQITAEAKMLSAQNETKKIEVERLEAEQKPGIEMLKGENTIKGKTIDLAKTLVTHEGDREDAAHQRNMDVAEHARNLQTDAVDATRATTEGLKVKGELERGQHEQGLATAQAGHQMRKESREGSLAEAQLLHEIRGAEGERDLAERQFTHQRDTDNQGIQTERMKLGVQQQDSDTKRRDSDTKRHVALHPPKPAGPKSKKKK